MLNFLKTIFHFHDWQYTDDDHRWCTVCGRKQWRSQHCLGLNPPEYIYTWYDVVD